MSIFAKPRAIITWVTVNNFFNGWTNQVGGVNAQYGVDQIGFVYLRGAIAGGVLQTTAFILPVGYRPSVLAVRTTNANNLFAMFVIQADGSVQPWAGSNIWFQLEANPHAPA